MVYKSKIGGISYFPMIILGTMAVAFILLNAWSGVFALVFAGLFVGHLFLMTDYTIAGDQLHVRSGFVINKRISILAIKKITATDSILSAPALSLDRIEVFYNTYDSVVISPKDKAGFIAALKAINDKIEVGKI